jgi:ribonuclease-3
LTESLQRLQEAIGYRFRDPQLLTQALTHRSCGAPHNERLEFLGDGLLNFVIGEAVFATRARANEGEMSRLRASLVRGDTLAVIARRLEFGDSLHLGSGELKSGGYRRDSILGDAVEALLAAVYLDGGFEAARAVCLRLFAPELESLPDAVAEKDAKTRLQETLQADGRPLPEYLLLEESGPPHQRRFHVRCRLIDDGRETDAQGAGRKVAEQRAAERMLALLAGGGSADA